MIKDSVNFPACSLPARDEEHVHRCTVITENRPGMLGDLMSVFGEANLNVVQQINTSKGELAYNVIDIELPRTADGKVDVGESATGSSALVLIVLSKLRMRSSEHNLAWASLNPL